MNDLVTTETDIYHIDLENPEMVSKFVASIANVFVRASELAARVNSLQEQMNELRQQVQAANHMKEVADAAYNTVNAQRIDAENQCHSLRTERNAAVGEANDLRHELGDIKARVVTLEAEIIRVKEAHDIEVAHLVAEKTRAETKAKEYEDLYNLAETDKADLNTKLFRANAELTSAQDQVKALKEVNEKLNAIITDINKVLKPEEAKSAKFYWENQPRDPLTKQWVAPDTL